MCRSEHVAVSIILYEQVKKRAYEQRIREVEHATFTPLVLSATGGLAIGRLILSIRDSPPCSLPSGTTPTAAFYAGHAAV